jgi:hypothetical protein
MHQICARVADGRSSGVGDQSNIAAGAQNLQQGFRTTISGMSMETEQRRAGAQMAQEAAGPAGVFGRDD